MLLSISDISLCIPLTLTTALPSADEQDRQYTRPSYRPNSYQLIVPSPGQFSMSLFRVEHSSPLSSVSPSNSVANAGFLFLPRSPGSPALVKSRDTFQQHCIMDNIFGKEDSGNESEHADIEEKEEKSSPSQNSVTKDVESMDVDNIHVKEEFDAMSSQSQSDGEEVGSNLSCTVIEDQLEIVKHEIESREEEQTTEDIFENDIVLPHANPTNVKERRESKEKSKKELEEEEREKMQVLVSNFTEDQLDRYEMYRRAAFPKAAIKRIMQTITGCSVSQNVVIAMSGIAKVFVGEIVEGALDVMEDHQESGPLQPKHLREAVRRLRLQGQIPNGRAHKAFFRL